MQEDFAAAAETAVDICLGLKRNAQLWQDVAPRFQRARAMGPLLGCLLPRVLAGQLQSLAPEVMQARAGPLLQQFTQPPSMPLCLTRSASFGASASVEGFSASAAASSSVS